MTAPPALELRGLGKIYGLPVRRGWRTTYTDHHAVQNVSLTLPQNAVLGLVGESGSGKTTTGMMAMRLI